MVHHSTLEGLLCHMIHIMVQRNLTQPCLVAKSLTLLANIDHSKARICRTDSAGNNGCYEVVCACMLPLLQFEAECDVASDTETWRAPVYPCAQKEDFKRRLQTAHAHSPGRNQIQGMNGGGNGGQASSCYGRSSRKALVHVHLSSGVS